MPAFDHDFDDIAGVNGYYAIRVSKLRQRCNAVGLVPNVYKNVTARDLENPAFEDLMTGGWGEVAVIFEKVLILFRVYGGHRRFDGSGCIMIRHRVRHCVSSVRHCVNSPV
jgi:hypothetical protein